MIGLRFLALAAHALVIALPSRADAPPVLLSELARPGRVLLLRHAHAPGTGDPANFALGDCSTQRNLDAAGRDQARQLGRALQSAGVKKAMIYSSQWCRARETAQLLGLGPVKPLPVLNSFFARPQDRERILAGLREFLAKLPVGGVPVILVTHQVVVNAFADAGTPSGGGSIFQLNGTGSPEWIGAIQATSGRRP